MTSARDISRTTLIHGGVALARLGVLHITGPSRAFVIAHTPVVIPWLD